MPPRYEVRFVHAFNPNITFSVRLEKRRGKADAIRRASKSLRRLIKTPSDFDVDSCEVVSDDH